MVDGGARGLDGARYPESVGAVGGGPAHGEHRARCAAGRVVVVGRTGSGVLWKPGTGSRALVGARYRAAVLKTGTSCDMRAAARADGGETSNASTNRVS